MERVAKIRAQREEWDSKLRCVPGTRCPGYAHFEVDVEILEGDPPDDVLFNCADNWGWNFGGRIVRWWRESNRRFVRVHVYMEVPF